MAKNQPPKASQSRLSFAHEDLDLRAQSSLYQKTESLTDKFEVNRCPYNARQLADRDKTEAQRRRESIAYNNRTTPKQGKRVNVSGSGMVRKTQPKQILKPPLSVGPSVDAQTHMTRLAQERRAERRKQYQQARTKGSDKAQSREQDVKAPPDRAMRKKLYAASRNTTTTHQRSHGGHRE